MRTFSNDALTRRFCAVIALVCCLSAIMACASAPRGELITGRARVEPVLPAGEIRRLAFDAARRDAYEQILSKVNQDSSLSAMMSESAYVASRVRGAIQRLDIRQRRFHDDGSAIVVIDMDMAAIRSAAHLAAAETN